MNIVTNPFKSKWWIGPEWRCTCGCGFKLTEDDKVTTIPINDIESRGRPSVHVICPCCGADCRAGKENAR